MSSLDKNHMRKSSPLILTGLFMAISLPFIFAWFSAFLMHTHQWAPSINAHGQIAPPGFVLRPDDHCAHWTLWIINNHNTSTNIPSQQSQSWTRELEKIPFFFDSNLIQAQQISRDQFPSEIQEYFKQLDPQNTSPQNQIVAITDPHGYLALVFEENSAPQHILADLKVLLKHQKNLEVHESTSEHT